MLKVIDGGIQVLVEDWPGRIGYLNEGISPAGAMDHFAHRAANLLLKNPLTEATLEIVAGRFKAEIQIEAAISVTGADVDLEINEEKAPLWTAIKADKGDVISVNGIKGKGFRSYLAITSGIDVPKLYGSKSTCTYGSYGGYEGRALQEGDKFKIIEPKENPKDLEGRKLKDSIIPDYRNVWNLRAIPGPLSFPDYLTEKAMEKFFSERFEATSKVDRSGCRLKYPEEIEWTRTNGRIAGGHPSNIIPIAYPIPGGLNIGGDTPIILSNDGPSGGGYVVPLGVIYPDLWKIGQIKPSKSSVTFEYCTQEKANEIRKEQDKKLREDSITNPLK